MAVAKHVSIGNASSEWAEPLYTGRTLELLEACPEYCSQMNEKFPAGPQKRPITNCQFFARLFPSISVAGTFVIKGPQ